MTKYLIPFLIFLSLISCSQNNTNKVAIVKTDTPKIEIKSLPVDKIAFNFTFEKKKSSNVFFKINATLTNSYQDTVYFLTWSCDGLVYDIIYDTTQMSMYPHYSCERNSPMVEKIPPSGKFNFDALFLLKTKNRKINLGYDFHRVEKDFNTKADPGQLGKYEIERQKTILISKEAFIE